MANNDPPPLRARRWIRPRNDERSPPYRSYRLAFRLIGIPVLAVAGLFLYQGLRDRLVLPDCGSQRAKQTLSDVLKQLKLEPTRYEPVTTVSNSKDQVVCNAVLPLPDGGNVVADFTFYWDGGKANMKYSISRKAS